MWPHEATACALHSYYLWRQDASHLCACLALERVVRHFDIGPQTEQCIAVDLLAKGTTDHLHQLARLIRTSDAVVSACTVEVDRGTLWVAFEVSGILRRWHTQPNVPEPMLWVALAWTHRSTDHFGTIRAWWQQWWGWSVGDVLGEGDDGLLS